MMEEIRYSDKTLSYLDCALSTPDNKHICRNPGLLSCGHYICKKCVERVVDCNKIVCSICNETNNGPILTSCHELFNRMLEDNIQYAVHKERENFFSNIEAYENRFTDEIVDESLQADLDEINLRLERLIDELNNMYEPLKNKLQETVNSWKLEMKDHLYLKSSYDTCEKSLEKINDYIKRENNFSVEKLGWFQDNIKWLKFSMKEYEDGMLKISLPENTEIFSKDLIGRFISENKVSSDDLALRRQLKNTSRNQRCLKLIRGPFDSCLIPGFDMIFSFCDNVKLQTHCLNSNSEELVMNRKLIVKLRSIAWGNDFLFATDHIDRLIMKIRTQKLRTPDGLQLELGECHFLIPSQWEPSGICYYDGHVYVCDSQFGRIHRYNSNLKNAYESILENFKPHYLKNIENVAISRSVNNEIAIIDLNEVLILKRIDSYGIIGISISCFYVYDYFGNTIYCYDKLGDLIDMIKLSEIYVAVEKSDQYTRGTICTYGGILYLTIED